MIDRSDNRGEKKSAKESGERHPGLENAKKRPHPKNIELGGLPAAESHRDGNGKAVYCKRACDQKNAYQVHMLRNPMKKVNLKQNIENRQPMKRFGVVLITGASSGIGRELAYALAPQAEKMVLVARRTEKIEELSADLSVRFGTSAFALSADLSVPGAAERVFAEAKSLAGSAPDMLVNDAGIGFQGDASEISVESETRMIRLNVESLTVLSKLALREMYAKRHGLVLNIASVAGFQPGPYMAAYYATKSYVLSYSEALSEEARAHGVRVIAFCPGFVDTEFHLNARSEKGFFRCLFRESPRTVAWEAVRAVLKGMNGAVVPGRFNRLVLFVERFLSRRFLVRISARILKGKNRRV